MYSMKNSIGRDLLFGVILSALVFLGALVWGGPFLITSQPPASSGAAQTITQTATLSGTVMRSGSTVYLSLGAGNLYELQNLRHARRYEGKYVRVTGQVDSQSKLILVERIEA
jgi:hypothetical protein